MKLDTTLHIIVACLLGAGIYGEVLTKEYIQNTSKDKNLFLYFHDSPCPACEGVNQTWSTLMKNLANSSTVFASECRCSTECRDLCDQFRISEYPTVLFGEMEYMQKYLGALHLENLEYHAKQYLNVLCSKTRNHTCTEDQMADLHLIKNMSFNDKMETMKNSMKKMQEVEKKFKKRSEYIQKKYEEIVQDRKKEEEEITKWQTRAIKRDVLEVANFSFDMFY